MSDQPLADCTGRAFRLGDRVDGQTWPWGFGRIVFLELGILHVKWDNGGVGHFIAREAVEMRVIPGLRTLVEQYRPNG